MSTPQECGLKKEKDADNNIIIRNSTLIKILLPQLKNMTARYKVMCVCECCIYTKIMHSYLLTWCACDKKQHKNISYNEQNIRYGEISSSIFETYKNEVRPHGCHIYNTAAYMTMATMCPCTYKHHGPPQMKCVLRFCDKGSSIFIHSQ